MAADAEFDSRQIRDVKGYPDSWRSTGDSASSTFASTQIPAAHATSFAESSSQTGSLVNHSGRFPLVSAQPVTVLSPLQSSVTLATTIMGLSVTAAPLACAGVGLVLFAVLVLWHMVLAWFSCHLLVQVSRISSEKTWVAVGEAAGGRIGVCFAALVLISQTSSTLTSYVVLIKTMGARTLFGPHVKADVQIPLVLAVVALFLLPLCLLKDIRTLSRFSYGSICVYLIVTLTTLFSTSWTDLGFLGQDGKTDLEADFRIFEPSDGVIGILQKLPSMIFPFVCHHTLLPIYSGLKDGTPRSMDKTCFAGYSIAAGLYMIIGVCGYFAFRDFLLDDDVDKILDCFPHTFFYQSLRIAMLAAVLVSFPIIHFGTRKVFYALFWGTNSEANNSQWKHVCTTLLIVGYVTALALIASNLTVVFQWGGATVSPTMMLIYPSVVYLKCWRRLPDDGLRQRRVRGAWFLIFWGLLIMGLCVVNNVLNGHKVRPKSYRWLWNLSGSIPA